jgi:hypothetical protein
MQIESAIPLTAGHDDNFDWMNDGRAGMVMDIIGAENSPCARTEMQFYS